MNPEDYKYYCDLRRYGSCRHAGYGLGFERMVMYLTGINNIRDVELHPVPWATRSSEKNGNIVQRQGGSVLPPCFLCGMRMKSTRPRRGGLRPPVKPSPPRGEGGPQGRMRGRYCNDAARRVVAPYTPGPPHGAAPTK